MSSEDLFIKKLSAAPTMEAVKAFVMKHPGMVAMPVGAAAATAYQYLNNKPRNGGKSREQEVADARLQQALANKKSGTLASDMELAKAHTHQEVAKTLAKNPFRGALLAAPVGAATAGTLVTLARGLAKLAK